MDDLVQWLTARLDTDEQIAREATEGPWRNAPTARHHATASGRSEEAVFASPSDVGAMVVAVTGEAVERRNLVNAEFIAAHDPVRVLREVDAKRKLVRWHYRRPGPKWDTPEAEGFECATCDQQFPCLTLRLLAAVYSDRDGYREEWSP